MTIDEAFAKARDRAAHALAGTCPDGKRCPPKIDDVLADLLWEITGDERYSPKRRGGGGGC